VKSANSSLPFKGSLDQHKAHSLRYRQEEMKVLRVVESHPCLKINQLLKDPLL